MAFGWILAIIGFWIPSGIKAADHGQSGPLTFHCPGNEDMIAFLEDKKSMQDLCGPRFEVMFNASMENLHNGKMMLYFASLPDPQYGVPLMSSPIDMGSTTNEWSLSSPVNIDQADMPCGTGYIVVTVDNNGQKYTAAQRAVKTCDFSDIDIELHMDVTTPNHTVYLYPGGNILMEQLNQQGVYIHQMGVRNNGHRRVDNTTMENPHAVMFFLRHHNAPETIGPGCSIPSFRLSDALLGGIMFVDGIEPYHTHTVEDDPMKPISVNFSKGIPICGDAVLVVLFDPLAMLNDSNPCNNFIQLHVHVDCSMTKQNDRCIAVPNDVMAGREALLIFQEMNSYGPKMYTYQVHENKWDGIDAHNADRHIQLVGFGKFIIMKKVLSHVYDKYYSSMSPCTTVMKMIKRNDGNMFERIIGQSNYTLDQSVDAEMEDLKTRIMNLNVMVDNEGLRKDIERFGNNTSLYMMNEIMKSKVMGISYGLQYVLGIKYGIGMAQMMNQKIPENMTRTALGTAINDFSKTLWHASEQSPMMRSYLVSTTVQHAAMMSVFIRAGLFIFSHDIQMNVENIVDNILDFPEAVLGNSTKCGGSRIQMMARYMYYVSRGYEGDVESKLDDNICQMLMVSSYLRHGGAYLLAKDIFKEVEEMMNKDKSTECRRHPYLPEPNPPTFWHVKDGRVMMGSYSPLADKMIWKLQAVCRCDGCPGRTTHTDGGYSTTSSSWNANNYGTTDGSHSSG